MFSLPMTDITAYLSDGPWCSTGFLEMSFFPSTMEQS